MVRAPKAIFNYGHRQILVDKLLICGRESISTDKYHHLSIEFDTRQYIVDGKSSVSLFSLSVLCAENNFSKMDEH